MPLFLYLYYNKFFFNCQENAFHLAEFFFCCDLYLRQYSVSKIYTPNNHFDFYNTNNHLCQAKSSEVAAAASYDVPLCVTIAPRRNITSLAQILIHINHTNKITLLIIDGSMISTFSVSAVSLITSFSLAGRARAMDFIFRVLM